MDSGNSGSMQSSSTGGGGGGDEEYDSRVESSLSAFLNNASQPASSSLQSRQIIQFSSAAANHNNKHMLDPFSNYLDPTQRSHLDMMWSKASRSEPNQSDLGGLIPSSIPSSSPQNQQPTFLSSLGETGVVGVGVGFGHATFPTTHNSSSIPAPESRGLLLSEDQAQNNNKNMARNPKKRSRASRRAPTTVLTTDTTNFRAMVQEFTGIPAPPFTSSPFTRARLDLFGSSSSSSSTIRSLDTPQPPQQQPQPPPYLLRPFAQKLHPFPPSSTSSIPISMLDNNNNTLLLGSNHSGNNLPSNSTQFMMNNNMHNNPILSFQSILQGQQAPQNSKYPPLGNSSHQTQPSLEIHHPPNTGVDDNSHLKMSVFEELGLSHAHVNNMASSSSRAALSSRINNNNNNDNNNICNNPSSLDWVQRTGTTSLLPNNNDGDDGNYSNNNIPQGEKGPECGVVAAARSEGMVESWINCSSD
ncbi:hypothetical protein RIF29_08644 [Crotalaria pallida]|uniref:VQ domain-containing protein n=1 Tax=Crotalaria pallida TaxID=3830 RepID=A0AAN9FTZ8_CROPI